MPTLSNTMKDVGAFVHPRHVSYLVFYVTNRCNFRCNFCFYNAEITKGAKPDELTLDEIRKLASNLGPLLQLTLTGGEPFLRAEFTDITACFVESTRVPYVTIPTNASLPDRLVLYAEEILPRFPNTHFRVCFSIEGIEDEHDRLRSAPGSFRKIRESYRALDLLRQRFHNLVLDANSVFTAASEQTLLETLKYLAREFRFDNLSVSYARGNMPNPELKQVSEARYREINAFLESLERRKERRAFYPLFRGVRDTSRDVLMQTVFEDRFVAPCVAGRKLIIISETGDVLPCEILGKTLGNLRQYDFDLKRLTAEARCRELTKWIVESKCKCSFECALAANVVWNPRLYPKLALSTLKNIGKSSST